MFEFRWSETRRFKRCRRSWLNGYVLGWRLPEFDGEYAPSTKRDVGTLVHRDLEAYYNGETERPGLWLQGQEQPESAAFGKEWAEVYTLAQIMLDGYGDWLAEEGFDAGETTIATELELTVPLADDVNLIVHIDRLLEDSFGRIIVEDTKTVDSLNKGSDFAVDEQLLTYSWAVEKCYDRPVAEARHNMLRRVKRTARANPPFYGRVSIAPSQDQIRSTEENLRATVVDMVRVLTEGGPFYPNATKDCSWDCDFLAICAAHDDGTNLDTLRQELYIKR